MPSSSRAEDLLAGAPLFAGLDGKSLEELAAGSVRRSYGAGESILEEGSIGLGMVLVTSGRVEVRQGTGEDRVILAELGPGEIVGEMALFDDHPRSASAVALEPVEVLLLPRESFKIAVESHPEILWCVVPTLTARLREMQQKSRVGGAKSEAPADGTAAAASPPQPEQETRSEGTSEKKLDVEIEKSLVRGMRMQYALIRSGVAALSGMLRASESFLDSLEGATGIQRVPELKELVDKMPDALAGAARAALAASEKLPDETLEAYRRHSRSA